MLVSDRAIFRDVRLRSLLDSPLAFGARFDVESKRTDAEWLERAAQRTEPGHACTFLAFNDDVCCGVVSCFRSKEHSNEGEIVSMWVAPEVRRRGVGERLITAAEGWEREQGFSRVRLSVTENNSGAIGLYRRCGFEFTGESEAYPNDPGLRELGMGKELARGG